MAAARLLEEAGNGSIVRYMPRGEIEHCWVLHQLFWGLVRTMIRQVREEVEKESQPPMLASSWCICSGSCPAMRPQMPWFEINVKDKRNDPWSFNVNVDMR